MVEEPVEGFGFPLLRRQLHAENAYTRIIRRASSTNSYVLQAGWAGAGLDDADPDPSIRKDSGASPSQTAKRHLKLPHPRDHRAQTDIISSLRRQRTFLRCPSSGSSSSRCFSPLAPSTSPIALSINPVIPTLPQDLPLAAGPECYP